MTPSTKNALGRAGLIAAACSFILGVAVYQGRAIIRRGSVPFHARCGGPVVPPIDGDHFLRSYPCKWNGVAVRFGHYTSSRTAEEVVRAYARKLHWAAKSGRAPAGPRAGVPALAHFGKGRSVLSYATRDGMIIGIVAFDNPETGGCDYFAGASPAAASRPGPERDCPGREPPGVPRPPRATRTLCIEGLGGLSAMLNAYDVWGRPSEIVADIRQDMTRSGWTFRDESSAVLTRHFEGVALLSFVRGHEQCIVAVDQDRKTGKMRVLIFWAERPWLPEGVAL